MRRKDHLFLSLLFVFCTAVSFAGQNVLKITDGPNKFILMSDGTLYGCCRNDQNQISPVPGNPKGLTQIKLPGKAIDVADGESTVFVVLDDGTVWGWGDGRTGQLGNGREASSAIPVRVTGITDAVQVVAEMYSAAVRTKGGNVLAWGKRGSGLIGDGINPKTFGDSAPPALTPVRVPNVSNIKQISLGSSMLALTTDGRVLTWGGNYYGTLGRPPRSELSIDSVGEVAGLRDVVAVAGGPGVSTVLKRDGTVWVWGSNWQGQFGNGDRDGGVGMNHGWYLEPRPVTGISGAVAIAVGSGRQSFALLRDGTLRGWGNTDWGQIGAGVSGTFQLKPVIPKIAGVKAVFAAGNNSFAVKNDGTLWAWGIGGRDNWPFAVNTKIPTQISLK